ncbi:hypothetical protein [Vibrio mediterranei]|uniref:hypothetical protein n=1 Tax=Vibrio mediterranei TaxID=689 RepID=UPI00148B50F4|nr:hypothetical protein [Vibrio mediterranei]NOH31508.1 hypothetical protein [Vibrio mediterranei]
MDDSLVNYEFVPVNLIKNNVAENKIDLLWCELEFSVENGKKIFQFLDFCNGSLNVLQISKVMSISEMVAIKLATDLYKSGVIVDKNRRMISANLCHAHMVSRGRYLRALMGKKLDLLNNKTHKRKLLGTLVETYHYVSAANFHLDAAVNSSPKGIVKESLSDLFVDELHHGKELLNGLKAANIPEKKIAESVPLPETTAVIQFLRFLGETDLLSYAACVSVNESPKSDISIKELWDNVGQLNILPTEVIRPFRGHDLEDDAAEHSDIASIVFQTQGYLSEVQQRNIEKNILMLVDIQTSCYKAIDSFYGVPEGPSVYSLDDWETK